MLPPGREEFALLPGDSKPTARLLTHRSDAAWCGIAKLLRALPCTGCESDDLRFPVCFLVAAGVMSRCGVHDERIYTLLVETLRRTPELGANHLAEYGEARARGVLVKKLNPAALRGGAREYGDVP